jgi:hypothetical protein
MDCAWITDYAEVILIFYSQFLPRSRISVVTHFGKQIHYDGAKNGDAVLEIVGEGPATVTPAEEK